MTMLDIHEDALGSPNAAYHEFLQCYVKNEKSVYAFVEGKQDPNFYRGLIENHLPDEWILKVVKAGNREKVLGVIEVLDWSRFSMRRICFFVDRDLSDFLPANSPNVENLYVTDYYSIENQVACGPVFQRVIEEVLNVTMLRPEEVATLTQYFLEDKKIFEEAMTPVMAQVLLWRRAGTRASLDNITPQTFFTFTSGRIQVKAEYKAAEARIKFASERTSAAMSVPNDLAAAEAEFRAANGPGKFVRGKYIMWFFAESIRVLHQAIPTHFPHHTVPRARVAMGAGNAIILIGPRLRMPASLRTFLNSNYIRYINEVGLTA